MILHDAPVAEARNVARRGARSLYGPIDRLARRAVRKALRRYARGHRRARFDRDPAVEVTILLGSAWGMGGTIRAALNLAGYLAQRHDVEMLSVMRRRDDPFFEFPPGVKVTALDDQRPHATPPGLRLARNALRSRRSVLMPPATRPFRSCSLLTDLRLARALRRRSGVLIGTHPSLNLVLADISPAGRITIGQEQMHLEAHHASVRRAMARRYPRLDALVVLTHQDARAYAESIADLKKLAVIPNSVRTPEGDHAPLNDTTVLAAGRLTPQKGFDLLILAFARVAATHPEWRLRICGGGPQKQALQRLIDDQGLAAAVTLTGPVTRLDEEMERASLFVLSSRFEGFPLVLLEAMSKGLPVVSFDCPTGPRDVIEDHRNGILVPAGNLDALAGGMLELITDGELRRRLGAEAARTANGYSLEETGAEWERLLSELRSSRAQ
jgi:glycosyltransferase involved in cell wall biosynthesis